MSKYKEFKEWYDQIPLSYQGILDNYMCRLEHNFERQDGALAKHIKKYKGNMTYKELAEKAGVNLDTLKKNISRGSKTMRDGDHVAEVLNKTEYELYHGETEAGYQSSIVADMKLTFENQTEKMQNALIYLAMQFCILFTIPEFLCTEYTEYAEYDD